MEESESGRQERALMRLKSYSPKQPRDLNTPIWRYLDFTKFADLLDTQALFFCRADRFEDKFEGALSNPSVVARPTELVAKGFTVKNALETAGLAAYAGKEFLRFNAISCWHMSPRESAAMWRLYVKNDEGVAVRSTFRRLRSSFLEFRNEITVGLVDYVDYRKKLIPWRWPHAAYFHKRKSFEHEKEVRAIITRYPRGQTTR